MFLGLKPATLLKKRLRHRCFPVNFAKFLRTSFLQNTSGRLLLCMLSNNFHVRGTIRQGWSVTQIAQCDVTKKWEISIKHGAICSVSYLFETKKIPPKKIPQGLLTKEVSIMAETLSNTFWHIKKIFVAFQFKRSAWFHLGRRCCSTILLALQ